MYGKNMEYDWKTGTSEIKFYKEFELMATELAKESVAKTMHKSQERHQVIDVEYIANNMEKTYILQLIYHQLVLN